MRSRELPKPRLLSVALSLLLSAPSLVSAEGGTSASGAPAPEERIDFILEQTKLIKANPKDPVPLANRGAARCDAGLEDAAVEDFTAALALEESFWLARYNRGLCLYKLRQYNAALEDFNKVLAVQPRYIDALLTKGATLDELSHHKEAIESYEIALKINPKRADVLINRGNSRKKLGDLKAAKADFKQALALEPKNTLAASHLQTVEALLSK